MLEPLRLTLLGAALAALVTPAIAAEKVTSKVTVDGFGLKVTVKGNEARVISTNTFYTNVGARFYAATTKAAEDVSGCKATQSSPYRTMSFVLLDCSTSARR